jgi:hypothetical protein
MKQKSDWKRITLLRKASFKKEIKILAANKRQSGSNGVTEITSELRATQKQS